MRARLRDERGSTLIAAVLVVLAMLGIGTALLANADGQSRASAKERTRESSFNLAEAAMNAHALQLTRTWPSAALADCTPASSDVRCPQATAIGGGYTAGDYAVACAGSTVPAWKTTVRDNVANEQRWSSAVTSRAAYDANGDGSVWLRSTATTRCHTISMVSQVSQSQVPITFPANVVTANWFATNNQGRKVIVDTRGSAAQPAAVVVRCAGLSTADCLKYPSDKGQVQPPAVRQDASGSNSTLTTAQLAALETQAQSAGTLWPAGSCPSSAAHLASRYGAPVVVKGPCNISVTGNTSINTAAAPGALIIENGTLALGGNIQFYGLIYMVNQQGSTGSVLNITGTAVVNGGVAVDGAGGITAGASKTNLVFDPRASTLLKGAVGATVNKNTFRVVPTNQ